MNENSEPVPAGETPAADGPGAAPPAETGGFRVGHVFPEVGRRVLPLDARRVVMEGATGEFILPAFEDATGTAREAAP